MSDGETSPKRRVPLWPFFFCVLPIVVGIALVVLINQPGPAGNDRDSAAAEAIPDLGSRGRSLKNAEETEQPPANEDPAGSQPSESELPEGDHEDVPEVVNTRDEIETWLSNLALATRSNNRRGIRIHHELLAAARPDELVDELVENALRDEANAWVRIQFYRAFHDRHRKLEWSLRVYDSRTAQFLGTDTMYDDGEVEELKLHAGVLLDWLIDGPALDTRVMSMLRSAIQRREPQWLLDIVLGPFLQRVLDEDRREVAGELRSDLEPLFENAALDWDARERAFLFWLLHFERRDEILDRVQQPGHIEYLAMLVGVFPVRGATAGDEAAPLVKWLRERGEDIAKIAGRHLAGAASPEEKRRLIQRIAQHEFPGARKLIDDGLARQDANRPDYLAAWGQVATTQTDLERLAAAVDDPEAETARGAIEGLRRSPLPGADDALRRVLEQGGNIGIRSQALGALLDRSESRETLLEEYLAANRPSSLRAVAVAYVSEMERLMRVVEEDGSPTVRKAALDKLGALRPSNSRIRRQLYAFFSTVKTRDSSMVIRADARKYADALKD